jgi:hypothetical protein
MHLPGGRCLPGKPPGLRRAGQTMCDSVTLQQRLEGLLGRACHREALLREGFTVVDDAFDAVHAHLLLEEIRSFDRNGEFLPNQVQFTIPGRAQPIVATKPGVFEIDLHDAAKRKAAPHFAALFDGDAFVHALQTVEKALAVAGAKAIAASGSADTISTPSACAAATAAPVDSGGCGDGGGECGNDGGGETSANAISSGGGGGTSTAGVEDLPAASEAGKGVSLPGTDDAVAAAHQPAVRLQTGPNGKTIKLQVNRGGAFPLHYDNPGRPNRRRWTCLVYLNPDWRPGDGGEVVLVPFGGAAAGVSVAPLFNRLLVFRSDLVLHRVLTTVRIRYCFTVWIDAHQDDINTDDDVLLRQKHLRLPLPEQLALLRTSPLQRVISRAVYADAYRDSLLMCIAPSSQADGAAQVDLSKLSEGSRYMLAAHTAQVRALMADGPLKSVIAAMREHVEGQDQEASGVGGGADGAGGSVAQGSTAARV